MRDNYLSTVKPGTGVHGSFYSYRDVYLDLDPTYKDRFGRPLMRMTIDFHENELKQNAFLTDKFAEIIRAMGAHTVDKEYRKGPYDATDYQTTHLNGGVIMGIDPNTVRSTAICRVGTCRSVRHGRQRVSAKCRLQSDRYRCGAGFLGGDAIRRQYLKNPGPRPCVTPRNLDRDVCCSDWLCRHWTGQRAVRTDRNSTRSKRVTILRPSQTALPAIPYRTLANHLPAAGR